MRKKEAEIIVGIVLDMVIPKEIGPIELVFIHQSTKNKLFHIP